MRKMCLGLGSMFLVLAQGVFAAPPGPDLKTVNCDQGKKIQDAVNAVVPNRDTTIVISGVCNENVSVSRFLGPSLTLRGSDSGAVVNNALGGTASVFNVANSQGVSIANLTIRGQRAIRFQGCRGNCNAIGNTITGSILYVESDGTAGSNKLNGGGISISESSSVRLAENTILGDGASSSTGIFLERNSWAQFLPGPSEIGFTDTGIRVESGSSLLFATSVHIHDVGIFGMFVSDSSLYGSRVTIERGAIGVEVRDRGLVKLNDAIITDMIGRGIGVLQNSQLEIQDSTISNTGSRGSTVGTLSSATIGGGTSVTGSTFNIACDASSKVNGTGNLQTGFTIKPGCTDTDPSVLPVP